MFRNEFPVQYEPEYGARIGLVPRHGEGEVRWFPVEPCVVLHLINSFEKDGKVIIHAPRSEPSSEASFIMDYTPAYLHEWVLDLETGETSESCLNPRVLFDFPVFDGRKNGKEASFAYGYPILSIGGPIHRHNSPAQGTLNGGVVKLALADNEGRRKGDVEKYDLPEGWYSVSEPILVPKNGSSGEYVVIFSTETSDDLKMPLRSHVLVLDGDNISEGPVAAFELPSYLPYGLHSHFVEWDNLV
uniref:Dioxygenase n=1 Tax=Cyclophora tenuis TaxID=216820 RepID=A0A7S1D4L2_CYCTE